MRGTCRGPINRCRLIATSRQRDRRLVAVNLRAEEDAARFMTGNDTLSLGKSRLKAQSTPCALVSPGLKQGARTAVTAFEQVQRNFSPVFASLFGGGRRFSVLVESRKTRIDAGLEYVPAAGQKTLDPVACYQVAKTTPHGDALIFAVSVANPPCLCAGEVDAAVDEPNVTGFCDLAGRNDAAPTRFLISAPHARDELARIGPPVRRHMG